MHHQDKLKRDRIGIIFQRAKKAAWDPLQKEYMKKSLKDREAAPEDKRMEQSEAKPSKNRVL